MPVCRCPVTRYECPVAIGISAVRMCASFGIKVQLTTALRPALLPRVLCDDARAGAEYSEIYPDIKAWACRKKHRYGGDWDLRAQYQKVKKER
ncbi:hypothetical protein PRIPAC_70139 [Pristionchus pacificus]|uniref:Uncharacterized protein n=1 Tax=Pristionchus pacificus TaxID=54126 RepID=A0A2A6CFY9_PRIPA|nr:hypothetical protein PRIPAC_70139 [Pristionchus pacificus]|eukprot:PDM76963.1 hypothetical protein PRIPAC_42358 [Pristionchus pacificus]